MQLLPPRLAGAGRRVRRIDGFGIVAWHLLCLKLRSMVSCTASKARKPVGWQTEEGRSLASGSIEEFDHGMLGQTTMEDITELDTLPSPQAHRWPQQSSVSDCFRYSVGWVAPTVLTLTSIDARLVLSCRSAQPGGHHNAEAFLTDHDEDGCVASMPTQPHSHGANGQVASKRMRLSAKDKV